MKNFDYLGLDASLLQSLIAVYETGKVSQAAIELNISQSTLSHRLDKAREIIGDSLFVRAGRNIEPTLRLREIIPVAKSILSSMQSILEPEEIVYSDISDRFVVAATDYERIAFLLDAYKKIHEKAPQLKLDFVWQKYDNTQALRNNDFDLAISPFSGFNSSDIHQRTLFSEEPLCFYDPDCRDAPSTLKAFVHAHHIRVIFSKSDTSFIDTALSKIGQSRTIAISLPSVSEVPNVLRGTKLIATLPSKLKYSIMAEFATAVTPFYVAPLTFKLFWHEQTHSSPKHAWLRKQIIDQVQSLR
jgi:DNA-binding transcriptional LysR family regulator